VLTRLSETYCKCISSLPRSIVQFITPPFNRWQTLSSFDHSLTTSLTQTKQLTRRSLISLL
jgi:hypothetical protein